MGKPSEDWAVLDLFFGFVASHCRGRNVHCKCPTWSGLFHIAVIGCWLSLFSCWTGYVKFILILINLHHFALFEKNLVAFVPRVRFLYMQNVELNLQNMASYESCWHTLASRGTLYVTVQEYTLKKCIDGNLFWPNLVYFFLIAVIILIFSDSFFIAVV